MDGKKMFFSFYFLHVHLLSRTFAGNKRTFSMTLHVFNPEHDIALAYNNKYFTAPHAGRQLRHDLDYLPALWAAEGDLVWVENVASAKAHAHRFMRDGRKVRFADRNEVSRLADRIGRVSPWGWDAAVKFQLEQLGIRRTLLPADGLLDRIRNDSNRRFASMVLAELRSSMHDPILTGAACYARGMEELEQRVRETGKAVIKAPWSSSGRGIRYVDTLLQPAVAAWSRKTIERQGGMMVEPYYNKVKDFGMEFVSDARGVHYAGLSVFHTVNGAYAGNSLADEAGKRAMLSAYLPGSVLDKVAETLEHLLAGRLQGIYQGVLGVDMMVVAKDGVPDGRETGFGLHPVVEINLRRTMGHVALALSARQELQDRVMRIDYDGSHYHLHTVHKDR